jgi:hypothetical protein
MPTALQNRITELNACQSRLQQTKRTYPVQDIQAEAAGGAIMYAFYNIDSSGIDSPFTTKTAGTNDKCELPVNSAIGSVRAVLEPKPGAVVDANDPRSLVDIFTDVCGVIVINNESGWYEGWIVHDVVVPQPADADATGHAAFGRITREDAVALAQMGAGKNIPGNLLTVDGNEPMINVGAAGSNASTPTHGTVRDASTDAETGADSGGPIADSGGPIADSGTGTGSDSGAGEDASTGGGTGTGGTGGGGGANAVLLPNVVNIPVSLGAWNALQGEDAHAYWELNEYTNWVFPLYEVAGSAGDLTDFRLGNQYGPLGGGLDVDSRLGGSGPAGVMHRSIGDKIAFGDDPRNPRNPDRTPETCGDGSGQSEQRLRFLPSGLAREIMLDVYARPASFLPDIKDVKARGAAAFAFEVAKLDANRDGVIQFEEVDIEESSLGLPNTRLYLAPNAFNRVVITREINDGLLAPRLAPSAQGRILGGGGSFLEASKAPIPNGGNQGSGTTTPQRSLKRFKQRPTL